MNILHGKISKLLALYIVLFSSVITVILTGIQLWLDYNQGLSNLNQRMQQIEQTNIASITQSLWTLDNASLQIQLDGLVRINDVIFVQISDETGKPTVSSGTTSSKNIIIKKIPLYHLYREKQTALGTLTVVATKENIYQQLIDTIVVILISQAIKTFLVSILVLILFNHLVTRHLEKISDHSKEIELTKKTDILRLDRKTTKYTLNDELDGVVNSINEMTESIYKTYTKLLKNQQQLNEREAKFSIIFGSLSDAVILTNNDREIIEVNPAFETYFGYTASEVKNKSTRMLYANPDEFLQLGTQHYNTETKETFSVFEVEYRRKDSTTFPSETMGGAIKLADGSQIGYIGIVRDISARKQAEIETASLQEQIRQAHKMEAIGQLTGGIAHDFNNILASILGYAELSRDLLQPSNDTKLFKYIDRINTAGERARDLIAQLLTFSRSGPSNPKPLNLAILIDDIISLIAPTIPSSIELTKQIDSDIPPVLMDETQMHQILMNLCINARDAMHGQGKLSIKLSQEKIANRLCNSCKKPINDQYVKLTVADTGTGIAEDMLDKIFDPFITTKEIGKGTGMGLSMVHGILHRHNSHVIVDTVIGKGTSFHLLIPAISHKDNVLILDKAGTKQLINDGHKKRILVVDDEAAVTEFMQDFLQSYNYTVTTSSSSMQALELFKNSPAEFDLVITDQTMPEMTGNELIKELFAITPDIPVILCSGYSEQIDENKALELGCAKYLTKPISNKALLQTIQEVIESTDTAQSE